MALSASNVSSEDGPNNMGKKIANQHKRIETIIVFILIILTLVLGR